MAGRAKKTSGQSGKDGNVTKSAKSVDFANETDDTSVSDGGGWLIDLVDGANDMICLCRHGRIAYINAAGLQMLHLKSAKRAAGRPFAEFLHPEYREIVAEMLENSIFENESLPLKLQRGRESIVDVEITFSQVGKPESGLVSVQARDITDKLRIAETVLRSENRYRSLVESALDLICVCEDGEITFINAAGAEILHEKEPEKLIGRKLKSLLHPDYHPILDEGLQGFVEELESLSGTGSSMPLKFVRVDGNIIDVEVAVMPFGAPGEDAFMIEARDITQRLRSTESLRERESRLNGILNTVADAIITIDEKGIIQSFNPSAENIFGYKAREVIGENVKILVPEPHRSKHDTYLSNYKKTGKGKIIGETNREEMGQRKDGSFFPMELSVTELRLGHLRIYTGIVKDITVRKNAEEQLLQAHDQLEIRVEERTSELTEEIIIRRETEEKLRLAAEVIANLTEAVVIVDKRFRTTAINPAFSSITGYRKADVLGKMPPFYKSLKKDKDLFERMWKEINSHGRWEGEYWHKKKNGTEIAVRLSVSVITDDDGNELQFAAVLTDITKRKQDEERIYYQANYDALTDLPNRALFHDRLNQGLATMSRLERKLGLMFIDLDGFKLVNDTLGHDIGDLLLQETALRLNDCIRSGDTVARLGGDEFTVIMPSLLDPKHAPLLAQRILDTLAKPYILKGHESFISGSIGVTIFPDDSDEASELIKNADSAMYRAKEQGKANYQFFTPDMNADVKERLILKNGLSKALENGEFELHYQPKLDIQTNTITGVEALMRWQNEELGLISPVKFIPVLEETGMVVEVGEWALWTACEQHKAWLAAGMPPIRIAVNLSARQLREVSFVPMMERVLKESGVKPEGLEIEITESMLMSDSAKAIVSLGELHEMGLHLAMDDFGTGYSSLSYLKKFPIDTIKIDRSFVADIATNEDDAEIIKTIISMGRTLNRKVVAEGVETSRQLSMLKQYQCDEIQGYYFCKPQASENLTEFLQGHYAEKNS
ncbi:MAG: PAS domain S-box protein [Rhodospirillaceae bacterium]|jgi:diguanylate cyclase (GGDEF)-like protein/PAS domain S-box-containing protein|nr:PAS domain S-box protein [Rhodospirillaceae bacterium]MBT5243447.1 PAS domain S-box protein [Rhodospirillaceae bacterium]MBT5563452.1 PAS domain S-box protein [Rhodospirillaceae bacterium]MBT6241127.1 PAS domain S-box protein [Rhodospirillaceae bacterium]MBT7137596.1 PAS domain S-box protein [Rhodospirillaceae bacterium]